MHGVNRNIDLMVGSLAIVPGLVFTFWADHTAFAGMLVFGSWALITGLVAAARTWRSRAEQAGPYRFIAWFWTAVTGLLAFMLTATPAVFSILVGIWALGFGGMLLVAWARERTRRIPSQARLVAVLSLALGASQLLMPQNTVVSVGLLGAYFVIIGVWLVIGALSPRSSVEGEGAPQ